MEVSTLEFVPAKTIVQKQKTMGDICESMQWAWVTIRYGKCYGKVPAWLWKSTA